MAKCEGCGAEMIWTITEAGRRMPLNAKPVPGLVTLDDNGRAHGVKAKVYQSHYATCPKAEQFRKPRKTKTTVEPSTPPTQTEDDTPEQPNDETAAQKHAAKMLA